MGAYGLYMDAGEKASLLIFEVYDGKYTGAIQTKTIVSKGKDAEGICKSYAKE